MILGSDVYLMGKSFGTAVATLIATELSSREGHPAKTVFKGLILEAGFTSAKAIIGKKVPSAMMTLFSDIKWPTIDRLPNLQIPCLILHGDNDDTVPTYMAHELKAKHPGAKLVIIPGGTHKEMHKCPLFYPTLKVFLKL